MRRLALSLVLALGAALAALAAPVPADSSWVLVQTDGARVVFGEKPELRGSRFVGRLRGSGTLVSVPEARVDADATLRANAPGKPAAPGPAPAPTPRPFETPPLRTRTRLRKTGEDARRILEGARAGSPEAAPTRGAGRKEETGTTAASEASDRLGRGEEYWRERSDPVRGEYEAAGQALADARARLEAAERAYLGQGDGERATFVLRVLEARDEVESARREDARAGARWESLQEEARKAGAFPGWLR